MMEHFTADFARSRGGNVLCEDPLIFTVPQVIGRDECVHIRNLAQGKLERATVVQDGGNAAHKSRNNRYTFVPHAETDMSLAIGHRLADLVGLPLVHAEEFQIIQYQKNQFYKPHLDTFEPTTESGRREMAWGGQRVVTALGYLSTVLEGGETSFPHLGIDVPAKAGDVVVFQTTRPFSTVPHPLALHGGSNVRKGVKWAFNLWFREAPRSVHFDQIEARSRKAASLLTRTRQPQRLEDFGTLAGFRRR